MACSLKVARPFLLLRALGCAALGKDPWATLALSPSHLIVHCASDDGCATATATVHRDIFSEFHAESNCCFMVSLTALASAISLCGGLTPNRRNAIATVSITYPTVDGKCAVAASNLADHSGMSIQTSLLTRPVRDHLLDLRFGEHQIVAKATLRSDTSREIATDLLSLGAERGRASFTIDTPQFRRPSAFAVGRSAINRNLNPAFTVTGLTCGSSGSVAFGGDTGAVAAAVSAMSVEIAHQSDSLLSFECLPGPMPPPQGSMLGPHGVSILDANGVAGFIGAQSEFLAPHLSHAMGFTPLSREVGVAMHLAQLTGAEIPGGKATVTGFDDRTGNATGFDRVLLRLNSSGQLCATHSSGGKSGIEVQIVLQPCLIDVR